MTKKKPRKNFLDPALAYTLGSFAAKSIFQSVIGYLGLECFKKGIERMKKKDDHGESDPERISKEESPEKT